MSNCRTVSKSLFAAKMVLQSFNTEWGKKRLKFAFIAAFKPSKPAVAFGFLCAVAVGLYDRFKAYLQIQRRENWLIFYRGHDNNINKRSKSSSAT